MRPHLSTLLQRASMSCALAVVQMATIDGAFAQSPMITIQLRNITTVLGVFVVDKTYPPAQPADEFDTADQYNGADVNSYMQAGIHSLIAPYAKFAQVSVSINGIDRAAVQSIASGSFTFTLLPKGNPGIRGGKLVLSYELFGEIFHGDCAVSGLVVVNTSIAHVFVVKTGSATISPSNGTNAGVWVPIDVTFDLPTSVDPAVAIPGSMQLSLTDVCNIPTAPAGADGDYASSLSSLKPQSFKVVDSSGAQIQGFTMTTTAGANIPEFVAPFVASDRETVALEFFNQGKDHYFVSSVPAEIRDLDTGVHRGWARTGQSFHVFATAATAAQDGLAKAASTDSPVCRFYIPPQHGDSHFFSASPAECASVLQRSATDPNYSGFVYESPNAFYISLPDLTTGTCPANTHPVYRLWNQRADSNHRYTDVPAIKAQMIAKGYVAEGYGPDQVIMCAPQ